MLVCSVVSWLVSGCRWVFGLKVGVVGCVCLDDGLVMNDVMDVIGCVIGDCEVLGCVVVL